MFNRLTHFFLFMYLRYFSFVLFNFVLMSFPSCRFRKHLSIARYRTIAPLFCAMVKYNYSGLYGSAEDFTANVMFCAPTLVISWLNSSMDTFDRCYFMMDN